MRVLHIINDLRVGGAEVLLKDIVPGLRKAGIEAEIAMLGATPADSFLEAALRDAGVPLHLPPSASLYHPRHIAGLAAQMQGFDVVHVHLFPAQYFAAMAAQKLPRAARPVLITTEHNTTNRRRKPVWHGADTWVYTRYARLVCVSEAVAETLADWVPRLRSRIRVISTALDVDRYKNALPADKRSVLGVPPSSPVLLCVGRLEAQKDQATLLRALPRLPGFHVALVGDGVLRPDLEQLARTLGVSDRVHFLGRRADVPSLLKMADVYVQPSLSEGWSIAILEVMASAHAPIVASRAPGLLEAVENHGFLFPIGDDAALAHAVQTALASPELCAEYRARCRDTAARHDLDGCVQDHIRLYRESLAEKK